MNLLILIYRPIHTLGMWLAFSPFSGPLVALLNAIVVYGTIISAILYWVK